MNRAAQPSYNPSPPNPHLHPTNLITRIPDLSTPHKILLDTPHTHKPAQQTHTPRFIVRPARPGAPERLLPDHGAGALAVDVEVAGGIAQGVFGVADAGAVAGEDGACQGVGGGVVDEGADLREGVGGGVGGGWGRGGVVVVVVNVADEDGAEEFGGEERVGRVGRGVDCRVDEVAFGVVVGAADEEGELVV